MICLVDNRDNDLGHIELASGHQVFDTTGRTNHNVDTALESADLATQRDTTINLGGEETHTPGNGLHGAINLQRELTSRRKNQSPGCTTHCALDAVLGKPQQALHQGGTERDGLSRSGASASENVAAGQGDGNGDCLKSKGGNGSLLPNGIGNALSETEILELQAFTGVGGNGDSFQRFVINHRSLFAGSVKRALIPLWPAVPAIAGWPTVITGIWATLT